MFRTSLKSWTSAVLLLFLCSSGRQTSAQDICDVETTTVTTTQQTTTTEAPLTCDPSGFLAGTPESSCYEINGKCYCLYKAPEPKGWVWSQADWYCKNISMGLLNIESSDEEDFVAGLTDTGEFWLSAKRTKNNLPWIWSSTGEVFQYTHWVNPKESQKTGCATFKSTDYIPSKWFVKDCSRGGDSGSFWFICESITPKPPIIEQCPQDSLDAETYMTWHKGVVFNDTLYCFSSYWTDWNTAKKYCQDSGLELVSLQDVIEEEFITQHITTNELTSGGGFWTSGSCTNSTWLWDSTGEELTYTNFEENSRICNLFTDNYKVWINSENNGKWQINHFGWLRQIICEKKIV